MATAPRYWLVLPAAGVGQRMQADRPKQYLPLHGSTVIEWSLRPFLRDERCAGIMVAIAENDTWWPEQKCAHDPKIHTVRGGADRAASVLAGVVALAGLQAGPDDWILVHDAARPCLSRADLDALIAAMASETVGALLATPVTETIKRAMTGMSQEVRVEQTVPREQLWRAQTPQMFKLAPLQQALQQALSRGETVTDESSAMEALGFKPGLIAGRADNLKITLPEDLLLAERILASRQD